MSWYNAGNQHPSGCYPQPMPGGFPQCPPWTTPPQNCPPQPCGPHVCYPVAPPSGWYGQGPSWANWGYGWSHGPGHGHGHGCSHVQGCGHGQGGGHVQGCGHGQGGGQAQGGGHGQMSWNNTGNQYPSGCCPQPMSGGFPQCRKSGGHGQGCGHAQGGGDGTSCSRGQEDGNKSRHKHKRQRGHTHVKCHKKGTECHGSSSSSCSSDSD